MNVSWQRRWHPGARVLGWVAGLTVIALAVAMALVQLLLPLLARHPAWVASQLSQRLQRPVSFASMEGRWTASGPLFVLHDVSIGVPAGTAGQPLEVPETDLKLDFGGWLLPSRRFLNLHLRGLQLEIAHDADDHWHVNGIDMSGPSTTSPGNFSMGLWLNDLQVNVDDARLGKHYTVLVEQLRVNRQGRRVGFGGTLTRAGTGGVVRTAGHFDGDGSTGRLWVGAEQVDLQSLLDGVDMGGYVARHGHGDLSAWVDWKQGKVTRALTRFGLAGLTIATPDGNQAEVAALRGTAGLQRTADGYELRWAGADGSVLALAAHRPGTPKMRIGAAADNLQLAPLLPWLALKPGLSPGLAQWLGSGQPHGELDHVVLQWQRSSGLQRLDLAFTDVGIAAVGKLPGLSQLQGHMRGDAEALSLALPAQATRIDFPHEFRQPFVLSKLAGSVAFWPQEGHWHIGTDGLDFVGAGYAGQARGEVILPTSGGHAFMDMYARLDHADVTAAKLFWPLGSMSPAAVEWLDRGLVSGQLDQAEVLVRGNLGDWPFRHHEGRFEARAQISDLTLDYGDEWPQAHGIHAVASFVNNGMLVEASGGQSLGVKTTRAVALIPDFGDSLLDLNVHGGGSGASLMDFVRKSPIASHEADTLAKLSLGGSGTFDFHLSLPLKHAEQMSLSGSAELKDADLRAPEWKLELDKLNGPMQFTAKGLRAGPLSTLFHGQPSTLDLAIAGANDHPDTVLSARLRGAYRLDELLQDYPSLNWLGELADGRGDFTIGFDIAHVPGSDALTQQLSADSTLAGIALKLPAPLDKTAEQSLPLHLSMNLPIGGSDLKVALGQVARGHFRLADDAGQPLVAALAFGNQMPQTLPAHGLRIGGHADTLDVTGWVQRVVAGSAGDGPGLDSIDVSADQAEWFGRSLGPMKIQATPQADALSVDVDGPAMAGNFRVPTTDLDKRGVTARLQRLYWPGDAGEGDAKKTRAGQPADGSQAAPAANVATAVPAEAQDPANTGINPAALPPFHLWAGKLRMGHARLGEARLETWPTSHGMHIDQLRALAGSVQVTGGGDWNGTASNSHTHMRIEFAADNLGDMLNAFGYEGLFNGGKTHDRLDASWPGAPSGLSLADMDGTLSVHVSDGRIPEVAPGVGRLFGLISVAELPRRLTLDFGDVFGKGLAFDSISGDFHLGGGNATTDNLLILGPAAKISITGRTGLRDRDYDQQIMVVPHIGNSLPIVGAVVGGPIGAAAGLAVQGLLGKGLNKAAKARYRLTGSWDKPVMTLVEKHGSTAAPTPPLTSPGGLPAASGSALPPPAASSLPAPTGSVNPVPASTVQP